MAIEPSVRPIQRAPYIDDRAQRRREVGRSIGKWGVALLLFVAMLALLITLQLYQLTSDSTAKQALRRSVAALTEIDALFDRNYEDLRGRADSAASDDQLQLRDFPIEVAFTRDEVRTLSREQLRDELLDRSADALYRQGTEALRPSAEGRGNIGRLSVTGITDDGLNFLRHRSHVASGIALAVFAVACAALAAALAGLSRGFGRLASVGAVVLAASIPLVIGGVGTRFYMRIISERDDTDYFGQEFLAIGRALAWIPIRNGIAFTLLGALLVAGGWALARWADRGDGHQHAYRPHDG